MPADLDVNSRTTALERCDCLLVTLEPPLDSVEYAIESVHAAGAPVIVTAAPPPEQRLMKTQVAKHIDYLVLNTWEAQEFVRRGHTPVPPAGGSATTTPATIPTFSQIAESLIIGNRARHVIVTIDRQCHVFYRAKRGPIQGFAIGAWPTEFHESAGARDAFCAMLAYQLIHNAGTFSKDAVYWATAAMSYAGGQLGVPNSMPTFDDVEDIVATGAVRPPDG